MTDSKLVQRSLDGRLDLVSVEEKRRKLFAISARVGVWGVIAGLGSMALAGLAPDLAVVLSGEGFLVGGLGAIGTSILVVRDLKGASLPLKLAAFVGIPFGASLVAFAGTFMLGWPLPMRLVGIALPVGVITGVTLMVLLLAGFISHAVSDSAPDWED
jgi:hypothetical protein